MPKRFDVTTVGSTMLRLSVQPGERLETAPAFQVHTAGTESNTMVALARMGRQTAWVSRLTDNALGRRVAREIGHHGVDVSEVVWTTEARNEVFFVEAGASPRPTQVIYDRRHSAVASMQSAELDLDFLLDTRILHLSGILPALSEQCLQVTGDLIDAARSAQVPVSFDVNYRAKLWSPEQAARSLEPLMRGADYLFLTREDAGQLFGLTGEPEQLVRSCADRFDAGLTVVTLGGEGGVAWDGHDLHACSGYPVEAQDRLGAGDCFAAGVLCGVLEGSLAQGMAFGAAMAALKLGIRGDYFVSDRAEVLRLLDSAPGREVGR